MCLCHGYTILYYTDYHGMCGMDGMGGMDGKIWEKER